MHSCGNHLLGSAHALFVANPNVSWFDLKASSSVTDLFCAQVQYKRSLLRSFCYSASTKSTDALYILHVARRFERHKGSVVQEEACLRHRSCAACIFGLFKR